MPKKSSKDDQAKQSKRFIEMARELGASESKSAENRAFGKVGLRSDKPKKKRATK